MPGLCTPPSSLPQSPARGSGPWAASWRAGLGTAVGCRGGRKRKGWRPPEVEGLGWGRAGGGPGAGGWGEDGAELKLHLPAGSGWRRVGPLLTLLTFGAPVLALLSRH